MYLYAFICRNKAVSAIDQVLMTLRFLSTGSFHMSNGDLCGLHNSTVSRVVWRVIRAIAQLRPQYVKMPVDEAEMSEVACSFYNIAKFPSVIGAIDGTHIAIQSPGGDDAEAFRNRKSIFSYNVQAVVNANLKFMDIVARWPGSAHDNTIFNNSAIKGRLLAEEFGEYHLLGDKGYANTNYLLTPLRLPTTPAEMLYNESHIRTRNTVERAFGVWKRRFPALSLKLRIKKDRVQDTIVAAAVLHNLCILHKEMEPPGNNPTPEVHPDEETLGGPLLGGGGRGGKRNKLIQYYFANL